MNNQKPTKGRPSQPTEMTVRDGEIVTGSITLGELSNATSLTPLNYETGLERLKAEAAFFKARKDAAALQERRRASALKGWQTRRAKAKARASLEENIAAFQDRVGEFEAHAKRTAEQNAIWAQQTQRLVDRLRFVESPKQTLLQRIVVAILGKLGVR